MKFTRSSRPPTESDHSPEGLPREPDREPDDQDEELPVNRALAPINPVEPWVQLKYFSFSPAIFPRMIGERSNQIKPGAVVNAYDKNGDRFGAGFYNPRARVPLRMLHHGHETLDDAWFLKTIERAVALRTDLFKLPEKSEAWRVINSDGDGLSGLMVDKYSDVLLVDVHSLGVWQRLPEWLVHLHGLLGTKRQLVRVDPEIARIEGIRVPMPDPSAPRSVRVREAGVRFEVNFVDGHKTGFFCDQRENRLRLAQMVKGQRVLDLCCYTGGFSLAAKVLGGAAEITAVDLDEKAIEQAKHNANLNQVKGIDWVHQDAFTYIRTMLRNGATPWDTVILDPPKLVHSRDEEMDDGRRRYEDLNMLAIQLVKPGGLFVTCSCSGLLGMGEFERITIKAAHRNRRRLQILDVTGAGPDHPVMSNCLESRYLKVIWARIA